MFLWRNKGDNVWSIAPLDSSLDQLEVLLPHLLRDRDQRAAPHGLWSLYRLQQHPAILTHLLQQLHLCLLALGKPLQLKAIYVEIKPVRGNHTQQPLTILLSQLIEQRAQRLTHTLQAAQATHGGQHRRRIGALLAARFEQTLLPTHA